jgi:gluconate 2-dehydrogenase gamma chain
MAEDQPRKISRRDLLKTAGLASAAVVVPGVPVALAGTEAPAPATTAAPAQSPFATPLPRARYENLTADEAETLEAIVARLIPNDEYGPGAKEAGAVNYIDRGLGGWLADSRDAYRDGLAAFDRYCRYSRGAPFTSLSPMDQDSVLIDVQSGAATGSGAGFSGSSTAFFNMVRTHTWQGTFGDPYYGGNQNFIGWSIIGYPGLRTVVTAEDQRRLDAGTLQPSNRSAYDTEAFEKAQVNAGPHGGHAHGA